MAELRASDVDPAVPRLDAALRPSDGGIDLSRREPLPGTTMPLTVRPDGLPAAIVAERPYLAPAIGLDVPELSDLHRVLAGQVIVTARLPNGKLADASGLQVRAPARPALPRRLDARPWASSWVDGVPTLRVWAPTAHQVHLLLWESGRSLEDGPSGVRHDRARSTAPGPSAATARGGTPATCTRSRCTRPAFDRVVENRVTDPYSVA